MGIYEMCIKLGLTYGKFDSIELCDKIGEITINEAVRASALIAKEKGTFTRYNWENISNSEFFIKTIRPDVQELVRQYGLRNSQLLTIAPTGSISTMFGVSGGIEPAFALEFERTTKSLHGEDVKYMVFMDIINDYLSAKGLPLNTPLNQLPEMFVSAQTLDWHDRIHMQAVWQKWIDASISSTVNLPKETTLEETKDLYMYAWKAGLKGCTIFRDGCKKMGILTVQNLDKKEEKKEESCGECGEDCSCHEKQPKKEKIEKGFYQTCPSCGSDQMYFTNGCANCADCGFSPCS
jgi:ribonucleoside-diphosphate reductase alpha chain